MLIGLSDLVKRKLSKIVIKRLKDYHTFSIPYLFFAKGRQFIIFYKFDKFEIDF